MSNKKQNKFYLFFKELFDFNFRPFNLIFKFIFLQGIVVVSATANMVCSSVDRGCDDRSRWDILLAKSMNARAGSSGKLDHFYEAKRKKSGCSQKELFFSFLEVELFERI